MSILLWGAGLLSKPEPSSSPPGLKFPVGNKPRCAWSAWAVVALKEWFSGVISWCRGPHLHTEGVSVKWGCFGLAVTGSYALHAQWWPEFTWTGLEDVTALGSPEGSPVHALPDWSVIQTEAQYISMIRRFASKTHSWFKHANVDAGIENVAATWADGMGS